MSYKVSQIYDYLNQWAPFNTAEEWDNVGLNIGDMSQPVETVLVSLDVDEAVLQHMQKTSYDLVITHHPLIYKPLKSISFSDDMGRILTQFLSSKTSLICAHTNLDKASDGVNDCLLEAYALTGYKTKPIGHEIGAYFKNKNEISIDALQHIHPSRRAGNQSLKVPSKIGVCGGSGHGLIKSLLTKGIDCFITGEVNYHDEVYCHMNGISLLLMGHKESEVFVLPKVKEKLLSQFPGLKIDVCM